MPEQTVTVSFANPCIEASPSAVPAGGQIVQVGGSGHETPGRPELCAQC